MDERFYRATMKIGGGTLLGRLAFSFLVICSIALGAAIGLLFVYSSDLPEIHALEDYRPVIVTELYADDGQSVGTFALQRRILITYAQIPPSCATPSSARRTSTSSSTGEWIFRGCSKRRGAMWSADARRRAPAR